MTMTVETRVGDFKEIKQTICYLYNAKDQNLVEKILLSFGDKIGDKYVILNNEYYEDDNRFRGLANLLDNYFNVQSSMTLLSRLTKEGTCNNNVNEVAEKLGISMSFKKG